LALDWQRFYPGATPQRIGLPVYPFAKERYWLETTGRNVATVSTTAVLHPLLHRNTSDLHQQCYTTTFTGAEYFIREGRIPATAYLEMARAAALLANPPQDAAAVVELHHLVWTQPAATAGNHDIVTALFATDAATTDIEIYTRTEEEEMLRFQGQAVYSYQPETGRQDVRQLMAQMKPVAIAPHEVITAVYRHDSQLLAELKWPRSGAHREGGCMLDPVITESMLQAAILAVSHQFNPSLMPVAADRVRIMGACTDTMVAWVHHLSGNTLDVDLLDQQGKICMQIKGLMLQGAVAVNHPQTKTTQEEAHQLMFFREHWEEQAMPVVVPRQENRTVIIFADTDLREKIVNDPAVGPLATAMFVYQGNKYKAVADNIRHCRFNHIADIQQVLSAVTGPVTLIYTWAKDQQETGIDAIFNLLRVVKELACPVDLLLAGHYDPSIPATCWDYSWIGFERSLKMLLPNVAISLLYTDAAAFTPQQLLAAMQRPGISWYKGQQRFIPAIAAATPEDTAQLPVLKKNGCYLITGGGGKLGFSLAQYLAATYQAKLILMGRTPLTPDMEEKLTQLKQAGAIAADYASVDISDREAMTSWVKQLPGELSGVIHAAGVEGSAAFYEKTTEEINAVLRPKTTGTMLLDQLLEHHPLDFVCYFSSSAALLGDFGSCDYAVANRFQMAYAQYRRQHTGKTTVINWPFWQDGGMGKGDEAQAAFYLKSSGQAVLETSEGIRIWEKIIRSDNTQTLVLKGKPSRMEQFLHRLYAVEQPRQSSLAAPAVHMGKGWKPQYQDLSVKECVYHDLIRLVAASQKISSEKLDGITNLADYGFDSISLTTFAKQLKEYFAVPVTPALFFNYATIEALSSYFVQEHATHMAAFYNSPQQTTLHPENATAVNGVRNTLALRKQRLQRASGGRAALRVAEEPIAIIGMSGRFPKADTVDQLWSLLEKGESGISEIPLSRWNWTDYFTTPGDPGNKISTNKGGFINHVDEFDPLFFEITPREAAATDPGQRLLLMEAYRAIEDAQIDPSSLRGTSTGVFVGMEESQYDALAADEQGVGNSGNAMISSRLSYYLDLHGPAIATNTACSSGLVALHQAVMSLRNGECEAALVAGVSSFILSPVFYAKMSQAGMLSKDGQCFSFSKNANGIGAGEAVVVLMLKPLSAAITAGNHIYGVVKASGINFDGKTNGVTAPNGKSQETLIRNIYTRYNIDPHNISHIVAHGTGTKLGDPVELNALQEAFKKLSNGATTPTPYCAVTSCKSNLGHTMAASGLVSVVSLLKGLHHHKIPASIHCEEENDYISQENSPFYINKTTKAWETASGMPLMGGVSAFGRSGTNAHVVIEEYISPVTPAACPENTTQVMITLSAKTSEQLLQKAADLLDFILHPDQPCDLMAMAYSLQVTREEMDVRLGFIVSTVQELAAKLRAYLSGEKEIEGCYRGEVKHYDNAVSIFNADADLQETVDKWIANRKLAKLLELWVKGLQLDWNKLYGEVKPARISLPKYPFAREKYWFTQTAPRPAVTGGAANTDRHFGAIADLISQIENETIETDEAVSLLKHIAYTK
ncbi:SDR family NAD(P)-dependent oxidoreductase, partial [Chitinophaga varians]|uniref:SDR family NAD(P)-dependent oxidoreductase n=1 Tax=Chitinophaga varians TaxID=2202339 RepID=UPI00165FE86D